MNIAKKHILVTGATSGIGRALVKLLIAKSDFVVHAVGRNAEALHSLADEMGSANTSTYLCDLGNEKELRALLDAVNKNTEHLDWIIHSAGYIDPHEATALDSASIHTTFETNVYAPMTLVDLFSKVMREDGGHIFISSTAGLWSSPSFPIYSASKAALNAFARSLAKQWVSQQRSSITICPGATNTPMRQKAQGDAQSHQSPDVVAEVIVRVISGESSYKNGDVVVVRDGADTLHQSLD